MTAIPLLDIRDLTVEFQTRRGIVTAEGFELGTDDALRGGHIVGGAGRASEADQKHCQQEEGAHEGLPG